MKKENQIEGGKAPSLKSLVGDDGGDENTRKDERQDETRQVRWRESCNSMLFFGMALECLSFTGPALLR